MFYFLPKDVFGLFSKFVNRVILLGNHFSGNWHPETFRETQKTSLWFQTTGKYTSSTLTDMFIRQKIILELTSWNIHVKYMWTRIQSVQTALSCPKPFFRTIFPLRPSKETRDICFNRERAMRENSVANGGRNQTEKQWWGAREQEMRTIEQKRSLLLLQYSYVSTHSSYM